MSKDSSTLIVNFSIVISDVNVIISRLFPLSKLLNEISLVGSTSIMLVSFGRIGVIEIFRYST
ncbi:15738_t:CDS:1, partial [Funneliformis caledonium]